MGGADNHFVSPDGGRHYNAVIRCFDLNKSIDPMRLTDYVDV
jgi:hypothetical protein